MDDHLFEAYGPPELPPDLSAKELIRALEEQLTPARAERIRTVAAGRSLSIAPVLDRIHDPHNASAMMRSADAFGIQRLHIISEHGSFLANQKVAKGTERWLDLIRYDSAEQAADALHQAGYRIFVAAMDGEHRPETLPEAGDRIAVVFGNEHRGVSPEFRERADGSYAIPMLGFVESLNVSVAAAVTLYTLSQHLHAPLSDDEREELIARMMLSSIQSSSRSPSRTLEPIFERARIAAARGDR